jgi:hypothetical protein
VKGQDGFRDPSVSAVMFERTPSSENNPPLRSEDSGCARGEKNHRGGRITNIVVQVGRGR